MPDISINSIVQYSKSATASKSGTYTALGTSMYGANSAAKAGATSAANNAEPGSESPSNGGGSNSTSDLVFGLTYGGKSTTVGNPSGHLVDSSGPEYLSTCSWSAKRVHHVYQVKMKFTLPEGISSSLIASASITFNAVSSSSTSYSYHICAPAGSTEQTDYQKYSTTSIIDTSTYESFSLSNTSVASKTVDITNVFKKCIDTGSGWVTFLYPANSPTSTHKVTISGTPVITYTLTTTVAEPPSLINSSVAIQKPNGEVNISWEGASGGTGNDISGYTIYWKKGESPTTSSYSGRADVVTTETFGSYSFTFSSDVERGSTYYFKIVTIGSAGPEWSSTISNEQTTVKVNSLPSPPVVTVDRNRIFSTGSTKVTFTAEVGSDIDITQTKTLYYATSSSGAKTDFISPLEQNLSTEATYYFWTYDGLEYSSNYTSINIIKNVKPSISSFSMEAIATYSPNSGSNEHPYVKNIKLSVPNITKHSSGQITSYNWRFITAQCNSAPSTEESIFGNSSTGYTNLDVTANGISFNKSYKVRLVVIDDIGESSEPVDSTNTFCIPGAPTIQIYNQKANENVNGANNAYFGRYIRIKYNINNTGLTRALQYKTTSSSIWNNINLTGTEYSDVDLNELVRNTAYQFRVVYTCNSITAMTTVESRTRAADITPTNISMVPMGTETSFKPYTQQLFNVSFNGPMAFNANNNVGTTYTDIYTTTIEYNNRSLNIDSAGSVQQGSVETQWYFNNSNGKTTNDWINLINGSGTSAPNDLYNANIKIIATNKFGETFANTAPITLNFVEGIPSDGVGTPVLEIQVLNNQNQQNTWKAIPTSSSRYKTFETQTLRVNYSGLKSYANQSAIISFVLIQNTTITTLNSINITASDWDAPSTNTSHVYTLKGNKYIEYILPKANVTTEREYGVKIVLANGENTLISNTGGLNFTTLYRTATVDTSSGSVAVNTSFKLTSFVETEPNVFTVGWECDDFGSGNQTSKYTEGYAGIFVRIKYSLSPNGNYSNLGASQSIKSIAAQGSGSFSGLSQAITGDIIYLGATLTITQAFQSIDNMTPTGILVYQYVCLNQQTLYRGTPNLLYGTNFFVMNATTPRGTEDELLTIYPQGARKKIFIGESSEDAGTFTITPNVGLIIDCGTWDASS